MKLIDKSALVAEIEDKINKYTKRGEESDAKRDGYGMYWGGVISCLNEIRSLLDTLEVKDVDLEKEFDDYIAKQNAFTNNDNSEIKYYNGDSFNHVYDIYPIAKHFFELGLKSTERRIV